MSKKKIAAKILVAIVLVSACITPAFAEITFAGTTETDSNTWSISRVRDGEFRVNYQNEFYSIHEGGNLVNTPLLIFADEGQRGVLQFTPDDIQVKLPVRSYDQSPVYLRTNMYLPDQDVPKDKTLYIVQFVEYWEGEFGAYCIIKNEYTFPELDKTEPELEIMYDLDSWNPAETGTVINVTATDITSGISKLEYKVDY